MLKNADMITILKNLINDKSKGVKSYFNNFNEEQIKLINEAGSKEININDVKFDNKMTILKETFGISRNLPLNSAIRRDNLTDVKKYEKINEEQREEKIEEISSNEDNIYQENENQNQNNDNKDNENQNDELVEPVSDNINENQIKSESINEDEGDEYNLAYNKVSKNENIDHEIDNDNETQDEIIDKNNKICEDNDNDNEKLLDNK